VTRPARLSGTEIIRRLATLPEWTASGDRLHRIFSFRDIPA
jgi:hypothetical protein